MPPVDVIEDSTGITLYADLPGVPKDKLSLQVEADTLTIEGEINLATPEGMEASHAEVSLPRFRRAFTLEQGARREQGVRRAQERGAHAAYPQGRACAAATHFDQRRLNAIPPSGIPGAAVRISSTAEWP